MRVRRACCSRIWGLRMPRTGGRTPSASVNLQRAAVARAVVNKPCLILADEPTSNLDDANATAALDLLLAQAGSCNATLVIATHDRRIRDRFEHQINLEAAP